MPKTTPFISVIVIAHDRKQYIRRAIASVVNQSLDRKLYEIIVVKKFRDRKIDKYIRSVEAKNIFTNETPLSAKIATGIEASHGAAIAILEDDDFFHRQKLAKVYETFKNPDICYYHDTPVFVDESGKKIGEPYKKLDEPMIFSFASGDSAKIFRGVTGCLVVSSDLAKRHVRTLRHLTFADSFLFFASLASHKLLYFDSAALTYYTIHKGSLANPIYNNYEEFCRRKIPIAKATLDSYKRIAKLIKEPKPERYKHIRFEISYCKAEVNLLSGREIYKLNAGDYINMLEDWSIPLLSATIISGAFPKGAGVLYYRSCVKQQRRFFGVM